MKIDGKLLGALDTIKKESSLQYLDEIIDLIKTGHLFREKVDQIFDKHGITSNKDTRSEFLDLIIQYINLVLVDDIIEENEYYNVTQLKRLFRIEQGDFYEFRYNEIKAILMKQIVRIYKDNQIGKFEAIHKSKLQGLFDLSYDQINEFVTDEVARALMQGGDITRLDAYYKAPDVPNVSGDSSVE